MALELIDGFAGKAHIGSDDLAALNSGCFGTGDYVFNYGQNLKATMTNANTCTIGTGALVSKGRRSVNLASTALTVQSGAQGQKRNDLVVARYAKASGTNVESCTLTVIKGTPVSYGTAADPSVTANDMKLWRIPIDGITPGTPVQLFETIPSIDALRDSVSQKVLFSGEAWGQVSLAEDAGAFDRILIRVRDSDGRICQPVVVRDGEDFSFTSIYSDQLGTYIKQQNNSLSGTVITRGEAWQRTLMSGAASTDDYFAVVEVVGLRS